MKRVGSFVLVAGVFVVVLALVGFVASGHVTAQGELPAADAQAVWTYVTEISPYTDWGTWPDDSFKGFLPSGAPHSKVVKIFVNDIGLSVASKFPGEMPEGTIIAKDNYMGETVDNPGMLGAVTIMYKVKGYNPEGNDWFWAKIKPDGSVDAAGKPAGCIGCHLGIPTNRDGVLRWGFEGEPAVASAAGSEAVAEVMQKMQQPQQMPATGGVLNQNLLIAAVVAGVLLVLTGFALRKRTVTIR
ncbi:MAG: cytochrome P460 family protein [Anaerolineae bacterium]